MQTTAIAMTPTAVAAASERALTCGKSARIPAVTAYAPGASTPRTSARDCTRSTGGIGVCVCSLAELQIDCFKMRSTPRRTTAAPNVGAIAATAATPTVVSGVKRSVRDVPSASMMRLDASKRNASVMALVIP